MKEKLAVIGIDSLEPCILLKHREELPNFSKLIESSPTFKAKSVFPADTIPAWATIYTGLNPANHGFFYVYDVFDPNLSDLKKLDSKGILGNAFWDHASSSGFKVAVLYPTLIYPAWKTNGIVISKSPFDKRVDWLRTEIKLDAYPKEIRDKYSIPQKISGVWGGFPGKGKLEEWADIGKAEVKIEKNIGIQIYKNEDWDLYFIYFNMLDIIQHRLWRFFDEDDPTYPGKNKLGRILLDYYKKFDSIVGEFMAARPDVRLIVMSDHGHRSRPIKTININEILRRNGFLCAKKGNHTILRKLKKLILKSVTAIGAEHILMKIIVGNKKLTKASKSAYSSSGDIDRKKSMAYLSNFAGIKSYPYGGIEINRELTQDYESTRDAIIYKMKNQNLKDGKPMFNWIKKREDAFHGKFVEKIYPDIIFELSGGFGVGWEICSKIYGTSYDHNVASGGHGEDSVFLMHNISKNVKKKEISIIDSSPTILDILGIDPRRFDFDGNSIFK